MLLLLVLPLLALAAGASPYTAYCISSSTPTCIGINVPDNSSTDLYVTIHGSAANGYTAWALGAAMANSLYFIVKPSSSAVDVQVTLSGGHVRPTTYSGATTTQLNTTFDGNAYVVSFKCTNCRSWTDSSGTTRNISASSQDIIWAYGSASGGNIAYHGSSHGNGAVDMSAAKGTGGAPVLTSTAAGASVSRQVATTGTSNGNQTSTTTAQTSTSPTRLSRFRRITSTRFGRLWLAHAIITPIALLGIAGLGALVVRFLPVYNARRGVYHPVVRLHWMIQSTAAAVFLIGAILGFVASAENGHFRFAHQTLGTVVYALVFLQLMGGSINHALYKRSMQHTKEFQSASGSPEPSYRPQPPAKVRTGALLHRWLGRSILILAIVAVGLAFRQPMVAVSTTGQVVWYVVVFIVLVGGYTLASIGFKK